MFELPLPDSIIVSHFDFQLSRCLGNAYYRVTRCISQASPEGVSAKEVDIVVREGVGRFPESDRDGEVGVGRSQCRAQYIGIQESSSAESR